MDAQRNLLFGVLAAQLGFVTPEQLIAAVSLWTKDKGRPLDAILHAQQLLTDDTRRMLHEMVAHHLKVHEHQPGESLGAVSVVESLRRELLDIADPDLQAAVMQLSLINEADEHAHATLVPTGERPPGGQQLPATEGIVQPEAGHTISWIHQQRQQAPSVGSDPPAPPMPVPSAARFRILRPHAKGGLGEVFLAEDLELNREVALKEIQARHAGRTDSRTRFLLEAEVTGRLEHPGIVPVYALGSYPDGRPYYAMRFIRGDSLKDAIDRFHKADEGQRDEEKRGHELRGLLRRFIDVCNAIEYAHSRGVLHRDLKPANVMLGKFGETLVVDWGLAKTVDRPEPTSDSQERPLHSGASVGAGTMMGAAVGTPGYMSPEQAAGDLENLSPASDVYSLGATLYDLLTGHAPFEDRNISLLLAKVKQGEFPPPRAIAPRTPKSLEAICLKAMANDPAARYASAMLLADDVEHWLGDEAVVAYREPWRERLLRWARRHKTWTQAAAATIVIVAVVGVTASMLINNSRRSEAVARRSAEDSFLSARRTVDDFFTQVSESKLLNVPGLQPLRRELLESALAYYRGFIEDRQHDPSVRGELAETYYRVGLIAGEIGSKADALASLTQAESLQRTLVAEQPASKELAVALANTCNAIGNIKQQTGRLNDAAAWFTQARSLREALVQAHGNDPQLERKLANSWNNLAVVDARRGRHERAAAAFKKANAMRAELARRNPDSAQHQRDLAQGYFNFALYQRETDDRTGALASYKNAVETYQALVVRQPRSIDYRRELAWTWRSLGDLEAEISQLSQAVESYQQAREVAEKLAQENPMLIELQADLAAIYANLGRLNRETAKRPEAIEWYQRARAMRQRLVAGDPGAERFRMDLASCYLHLGMAQLDVDALDEALVSFERALDDYRLLAEKNPQDAAIQDGLAQTWRNVGLVHRARGDRVRALEAFEQTQRIFEPLASAETATAAMKAGWADALVNIAVDRQALDQLEEALVAARRAVEIQASVVALQGEVAEYQYMRAEGLYALGLLQLKLGDFSQALQSYEAAVAVIEALARKQPDDLKFRSMLGTALDKQSVALWLLGRREEAVEVANQAFDKLRTAFDDSPQVVQYRLNLSDNYFNRARFARELGQVAEAIDMTRQRRTLWEDNAPELYKAACEFAFSAKAASETDLRAAGVAEAVQTLKQAIAAGLDDVPALRTDPRLDVLHNNSQFQQLLKSATRKGS